MKNFDHSSLDGRLLKMFVTVYDEGTVTAAADKLGVTQSTVSHGLNRLRDVIGDGLFVPMGRGITPTEKATELVEHARRILSELERFALKDSYDPSQDQHPFVIAASDYEVEVIIKPLIASLRREAPLARIEVLRAHSQHEWAELLRSGQVDLVLSPELNTEETDLMQQSLIKNDTDICYFDSSQRDAPDSLKAYSEAHHVIFSPGRFRPTEVDKKLVSLGYKRHIALCLPSFSAIASVIHDSDMVALMPARLAETVFVGLANCPPPFNMPMDTITQMWHVRSNTSLRHRWLRQKVRMLCDRLLN